jgi:hypothetical protein
MDRLTQTLAGSGLLLLALASGCRSTRDEVPPSRGYRNDGRQEPAVGFSTQPHTAPPTAFGGKVGGAQGNLAPTAPQMQPPSTPDTYGTTNNKFGAPGTSGLGQPPALGGPSGYPPQPPPMRGADSPGAAAPLPY